MPNKFSIPSDVEKRIRQRDTVCVYCGGRMMYPCIGNDRRKWATIEHLGEEGPFYWEKGLKEGDLAICCQSCNSSRGRKKLLDWFRAPYCRKNNINEETVGKPVKKYIKINERFS